MSPIRDNTPALDPATPQAERMAPSSRAAQSCGLTSDEMVRARLFCIQAGAEIEAISLDRAVRDLRDPARLSEQLTLIQREAKRARARGIYRSAQDVLEIIQRSETPDWATVDARLFVLTRLVEQYESGLEDVERKMAAMPKAESKPETKSNISPDSAFAFAEARQTLTELLPHASEMERAALEHLMNAGREDAPADKLPSGRETPPTLTSQMEAGPENIERSTSLDTILPDLVQRLLGVGHQFGKIISVSHAVENVRVPDSHLPGLQSELYEALAAKITNEMPLQGVGHLDISAGDGVLEITGSGFLPFAVSLNVKTDQTESEETTPRPGWRPMITDDTEADLRAQLAALLDGGL